MGAFRFMYDVNKYNITEDEEFKNLDSVELVAGVLHYEKQTIFITTFGTYLLEHPEKEYAIRKEDKLEDLIRDSLIANNRREDLEESVIETMRLPLVDNTLKKTTYKKEIDDGVEEVPELIKKIKEEYSPSIFQDMGFEKVKSVTKKNVEKIEDEIPEGEDVDEFAEGPDDGS